MPLLFKIIHKCWQDASNYKDNDAEVDFYLEENDWNDYGYYTFYHLHAARKRTLDKPIHLGAIRIMSLNQEEGDKYLLYKIFKGQPFHELPNGFISLSMDIDLYMGINRFLSSAEGRNEFIQAMHLILGTDSIYYWNNSVNLEKNDCFNNSLLRGSADLDNFALRKGRALLSGSECLYNLRKETVGVKLSNVKQKIALHFNCVEGEDDNRIPNGVLVFIGKNGSGKSTAIYRLAKLLYTDPTQRFLFKDDIGELNPNNVGVSKIFLISYSPFDNFVLPIVYDGDYLTLLKDGEEGKGRFIYNGIRDIASELEAKQREPEKVQSNEIFHDRQSTTSLKEISMLAAEFADALAIVKEENSYRWNNFLIDCKRHQPSLFEDISFFRGESNKQEVIERFIALSTGHKFFMHSFLRVLAYIDGNCLILFDEPENHLHPPLLSFMIAEFRKLLAEYNSVMFIATHSPIIVQETFANNVFVVRKHGGISSISQPQIETYGANLSTITAEVFDLTTDITQYHDAVRLLYKKWKMADSPSVDTMLDLYERKLGHSLTGQMQSYLISLFTNENDVEIE